MMLPLAGVRVLDLSNVLAGPFCAYQLALFGAEVTKVEHPEGGDLARRLGADKDAAARNMGASFVAVNAGKRSITLNLKDPRGQAILLDLVRNADVLVENFRPGVMDRLELGYDQLSKVNPALVYCSISGFGDEGELSRRPAYDQIIQGMSGVMSVTGDAQSAPLRVGYPVSDTVGGLTAAFGICAALVDARTSGRGRRLDVSMLEATLATMGWVVSNYLNAGVEPAPMGNENFTAAPSGTFRTGAGLLNIAANETRQFESLCEVIGRPDLPRDDRFCARHTRKQYREALKAEIETALAADSAANWETRLLERGVPVGRVLSVPEILAHPHLAERRFIREFEAAEGEAAQRVTRAGLRLADADAAPATPAPTLGAHTRETLAQLGYEAAQIDALHHDGVI
ncbi:CaiB/BaiF CoA transferase family protein [Paraburkholderia hiiakae]|nr:CoA transferase [Paraburkholderia hiiakae]